ncbi:death domain-containing protein 1 [Microcaecilia unicolor]|uniref:Death domain-containing protein 1 n=1 Tax=Microcaecilia unicolor TaxID=1415580 RepID=A0A6P7XCY4_9AMPH|nr:death domain-containing protein 1 [Microcaecilia unicolor]
MELTENVTFEDSKLSLVLEQMWQKIQVMKHCVDIPEGQDDEDVRKSVLQLISLSQELRNALHQQLKYTSNTMQASSQLLTSLQDHYRQLTSSQVLVDFLARVCEVLQDITSCLEHTENQLEDFISKYNDILHQSPTILPDQDDGIQKDENSDVADKCLTNEQNCEEIRLDEPSKIKAASSSLTTEETSTLQSINVEHDISKMLPSQKKYDNCESVEGGPPDQNDSRKETCNRVEGTSEISGKHMAISNSETCNGHAVNSSMNHPEEVGNQWYEREFLVQASGEKEPKVACYIKAPFMTVQNLKCKIINDMSSLVVSDFEELVSNVISIAGEDPSIRLSFPISIIIPFTAHLKGNYRDIMVKVNDEKLQSSYLTPVSLDEYQGNQKGSFAEVKVYKLGIFSVVSSLKKESFTIPKKGVEVKLSMDPRISLFFPPGCFGSSLIVQLKVQPIDASLISVLKVKYDIYQSVVSTSPMVHIQQPLSQSFCKPFTVTVPCPPNPDKRRQGHEVEHKRATSATVPKTIAGQQIRTLSASVRKHGDNPSESLKVLGYKTKEDQWAVLEDIAVRNMQNGLVSFEIDEHLDSFVVIRLASVIDGAHLVPFIQTLDQAAHNTMVNVVLYRRKDNMQKAIVELVPSKELNWKIPSLRAEGYCGPPEPSEQFPMQEGEQIYFKFSGNISASDNGKDVEKIYKLTFHSQRKHRLHLQLRVVDEYGNYSSPQYKGTALFYKVTREAIFSSYFQPSLVDDSPSLQTPVCKLALTLPKSEKIISRPPSTRQVFTNSSEALLDDLLYWLAEELSEEDAALLAVSLPIRRSTVQLIKLKSPDNLTDQIYELLSYWKKTLPTSADKMRLLSRHLRKSGRIDLFEELKFMWENKEIPQQMQHRFEMHY